MEKKQVQNLVVGKDDDGQRLDNFLRKTCKGVPMSRIYRALRSGEVRINKGRVKAFTKLREGDVLRVPPLHVRDASSKGAGDVRWVAKAIIYEDEHVLVLDKPDTLPVHKGSGVESCVVDSVQAYLGKMPYLVHRLDKMVSGCLLLVKSREDKKAVLEKWHDSGCRKRYEVLVGAGEPLPRAWVIDKPLDDKDGKSQQAKTSCTREGQSQACAVAKLSVMIATGRKHQIRRHLSMHGLPVLGDRLYGDFGRNKDFARQHTDGLFLHAAELVFWHPVHGWQTVQAPWPASKKAVLKKLFA
jgi:23S rRNA pseudouridine955/2504/2580 synthase